MEKTPQVKRLIGFLFHHYEIKGALAEEHARDLVFDIQLGMDISELMSAMQRQMEIPDQEVLMEWMSILTEFSNHTRQWGLKGHMPAELFQEEQKHLKPFLAQVEPAIRTKPGHNDPCPCGSGKKYKKCCLI